MTARRPELRLRARRPETSREDRGDPHLSPAAPTHRARARSASGRPRTRRMGALSARVSDATSADRCRGAGVEARGRRPDRSRDRAPTPRSPRAEQRQHRRSARHQSPYGTRASAFHFPKAGSHHPTSSGSPGNRTQPGLTRLRDAASSGIRSSGSGRLRHGPPELGAYVAAGELCFCRGCAEAIRPPAYVATVLGMTGLKRGRKVVR